MCKFFSAISSGDCNSGSFNSGDCNSGDCNLGNRNAGDFNSGDCNVGNRNSGDCNVGNRNSGYGNSGDRNSGDCNSGDCNSGHFNSGHCNSGDHNSGHYNSGDFNSGNFNSGDGTKAFFCNKTFFIMFNKKCNATDIKTLKAIDFSWFSLNEWICFDEMDEEEKEANPTAKSVGGFIRTISYTEAWAKCPDSCLDQIKKLRNFDPVIFKDITGIDID